MCSKSKSKESKTKQTKTKHHLALHKGELDQITEEKF